MSKWSGSDFVGPTDNNWPQGVGKFRFPNGVVYEGNFDKGEFHGDGTLHYPNGVSSNFDSSIIQIFLKDMKLLGLLIKRAP